MSINRLITSRIKKFLFIQEINRIINDTQILLNDKDNILQRLVYLWGNEGWSGLSAYLMACLQHADKSSGYILECGSGLSTILMGIIAKSKGIHIISLENSGKWEKRTSWYLKHFNLNNASILFSPIVDRGTYQWYKIEEHTFPEKVSLVILDGPPGDIKGGRTGFFPECKDLIAKDTIILVDDVERKEEMGMVIEFSKKMDFRYTVTEGEKPFATMIKN
jgi:hypothetical protein